MQTEPLAQPQLPLWWRAMQLLTVLAILALFVSTLAESTGHDAPAAPAQSHNAVAPELPEWTGELARLRLDHSVLLGAPVSDAPDAVGASVAAYGPLP